MKDTHYLSLIQRCPHFRGRLVPIGTLPHYKSVLIIKVSLFQTVGGLHFIRAAVIINKIYKSYDIDCVV